MCTRNSDCACACCAAAVVGVGTLACATTPASALGARASWAEMDGRTAAAAAAAAAVPPVGCGDTRGSVCGMSCGAGGGAGGGAPLLLLFRRSRDDDDRGGGGKGGMGVLGDRGLPVQPAPPPLKSGPAGFGCTAYAGEPGSALGGVTAVPSSGGLGSPSS
eukprot:58493-Chlamydomonas_euryale.AAC.1